MLTSQFLMLLAVASILFGWALAWTRGHRSPALQKTFAALLIQSIAAVLLSFSANSLPLSLLLAAVILCAVGWMIQSATQVDRA
jgi:hypothetical protein